MSNTKGQLKDPANSPEKPEGAKYEDKVLALAAEMAIQQYEKNFYAVQLPPPMPRTKFDPNHPIAQKAILSIMENFIPAARIAVKHMTKTARDAWEEGRLSWFREIGELEEGEEAFLNLNEYLRERGLIPPPNQPEGTGM